MDIQFFGRMALCLLALLTSPAQALVVPFSASFDGRSDIVGVLDPTGPLVQVQSQAVGSGVLGLVSYRSADQLNLGNGQGVGDNVFTAADGSQLFGHFTVQLLPTGDPSLLSLIGLVDIIGGSGRFDGADGLLSFSGGGQFVSATQALTRFVFEGRVQLVNEPNGLALALLALLLGAAARRRGESLKGVPRMRTATWRPCGGPCIGVAKLKQANTLVDLRKAV
jgi:hypothetical protein